MVVIAIKDSSHKYAVNAATAVRVCQSTQQPLLADIHWTTQQHKL
jgi:4-hydroxy-3-methylbut-2-en-1-yl diphosphate synthase IspG/GcpE